MSKNFWAGWTWYGQYAANLRAPIGHITAVSPCNSVVCIRQINGVPTKHVLSAAITSIKVEARRRKDELCS